MDVLQSAPAFQWCPVTLSEMEDGCLSGGGGGFGAKLGIEEALRCPTGATTPSKELETSTPLFRLDADRFLRQCQEDASRLMARRLKLQQLQKQQQLPSPPMSPMVVVQHSYEQHSEFVVPHAIEVGGHKTCPGETSPSEIEMGDAESALSEEPSHSFGREDCCDFQVPAVEECSKDYTPSSRSTKDKHVTVQIDANEEPSVFSNGAASDSEWSRYPLNVNPNQQDRATDIPLYSFARPHMRAFHMSWMSFFVAFFLWFSMTPLLSEIAYTLQLTHEEIWTSSCFAVASSAVTRILIGPLNDKYGARWVMSLTLVAAAIPTAMAGWIIHDANSLYLVRFFIGVAGSAFVTSQFWTSSLFCVEIAGTANALVSGPGLTGDVRL